MSLNRYASPPSTPPRKRLLQESPIYKPGAVSNSSAGGDIFCLNTPISSTKPTKHQSFPKRRKAGHEALLTPESISRYSRNAFRTGSLCAKDSTIIITSPTRNTSVRQHIIPLRSLTVGRGRRLLPSIRVASILEDMTSLDDDDILEVSQEVDLTSEEPHTPPLLIDISTPRKNTIVSKQVQENFNKSRNDRVLEDEESDFLNEECQTPLVNPFVETDITDTPFMGKTSSINSTPKITKSNIFNPFISQGPLTIDYATQMELINQKTGERSVQDLPASAQNIKPRRLNFSNLDTTSSTKSIATLRASLPILTTLHHSNSPIPTHENVETNEIDLNKQFIIRNLDSFINIKPKNGLDFEIFKDEP